MKCISTDMDGTLLNKDQRVSEENRKALEAVVENGGQVIVATGRSYKEARLALDEINFTCPIISMNGAAVYDEQGTLIASHPLEHSELKETISYLAQTGVYFEMYTNQGVFSKNPEKAIDSLVDIFLSANPSLKEEDVRQYAKDRLRYGFLFETDDYDSLINETDIEFYKILVFSPDHSELDVISESLRKMEGLTVTSSGAGNIEVNKKGISKGTALTTLLNQLDIQLEDTMAIGDNYNDVSMFEKAGLSVAMGNASSEIKSLCKEVTETNEENGVAAAVYKYIIPSLTK